MEPTAVLLGLFLQCTCTSMGWSWIVWLRREGSACAYTSWCVFQHFLWHFTSSTAFKWHLPSSGWGGDRENSRIKREMISLFEHFLLSEAESRCSRALGKYRATKGMQKVSVMAIEEISASFFLPACQMSNKAHLHHTRLMTRLERKDSLFPKFHSKLLCQQNFYS